MSEWIVTEDDEFPNVYNMLPLVHCQDCKFFETDHFGLVNGIPLIVAHEICLKWGAGCKTNPRGYCFMGERKPE